MSSGGYRRDQNRRYKRPLPKKKGRAPVATVVVHAPTAKPPPASKRATKANAAPTAALAPRLPTVVVAINQKRLKRLRAELRLAQPSEPSPEVDAFFVRNVRPGGPLAPRRKRL